MITKTLNTSTLSISGVEPKVSQDEFHRKPIKELLKVIYPDLLALYKAHNDTNAAIAYPVIKSVYEDQSNQF